MLFRIAQPQRVQGLFLNIPIHSMYRRQVPPVISTEYVFQNNKWVSNKSKGFYLEKLYRGVLKSKLRQDLILCIYLTGEVEV